MLSLQGTAASPGIAIGPAYIHLQPRLEIPEGPVPDEGAAAEASLFLAGRARAQASLEALIASADPSLTGIFEGHLEILLDEELGQAILAAIQDGHRSGLAAVREVMDAQRAEFLALEDPYLRERADDISDIARRLLYAMAGYELANLKAVPQGAIIIARDLTPSDTAQLDPAKVGGFAVETGGRTSHVAIMARTLEIPAVVGCAGLLEAVEAGQTIALDGQAGMVVLDPDAACRQSHAERLAAHRAERQALLGLAALPATTRDGRTIQLAVNIGTPADAEAALPWNPDGVGLYRTEFLFMDRPELPDEEEQYRAYAAVAKAMKGKPVIVRTLDVGGDKPVSAIRFPEEQNPFLGWRGVRMCLDAADGCQDLLRTQLRAILRAAALGDLWVMFPMISRVEEVESLRAILAEVREDLQARGVTAGPVKVGIMVETPAAALVADSLAPMVDFFSIGSNDLTQYTLAADRGNEKVAQCYQPFHPGVWRLIAMVAEAGRACAIPVGICGELGGMDEAALPLLGLGLDEFSMNAPAMPRVKRIIRSATMEQAQAAARSVTNARTAAEAFARATAAMARVTAPAK